MNTRFKDMHRSACLCRRYKGKRVYGEGLHTQERVSAILAYCFARTDALYGEPLLDCIAAEGSPQEPVSVCKPGTN